MTITARSILIFVFTPIYFEFTRQLAIEWEWNDAVIKTGLITHQNISARFSAAYFIPFGKLELLIRILISQSLVNCLKVKTAIKATTLAMYCAIE